MNFATFFYSNEFDLLQRNRQNKFANKNQINESNRAKTKNKNKQQKERWAKKTKIKFKNSKACTFISILRQSERSSNLSSFYFDFPEWRFYGVFQLTIALKSEQNICYMAATAFNGQMHLIVILSFWLFRFLLMRARIAEPLNHFCVGFV